MMISTNNQAEIRALIKANKKTPFYVYLLIRPDKNEIFYVGKGKGNRIFNHEKEVYSDNINSHKNNIIIKIKKQGLALVYAIDSFYEFEEDALSREVQLIEEIGRFNLGKGPLTNLTAGGDGFSDWINFEKHSTTGRVLSSNSGNLDTMMNTGRGATKGELLSYLENDGWPDSDTEFNRTLPEEPPPEYLWVGKHFYEKLRQGYGREEYLELYFEEGDRVLRKVRLMCNDGDTYYRREDELACIIEYLIDSNDWVQRDIFMNAIKNAVCERKEIDDLHFEMVFNQLLEELLAIKKIAHENNQYKWLKLDDCLKIDAKNKRPSQILTEIYQFSGRNKNICVAFLGNEDDVLQYLTLFPHHFRRGVLKTYFRQKVALVLNTTKASSLNLYKL